MERLKHCPREITDHLDHEAAITGYMKVPSHRNTGKRGFNLVRAGRRILAIFSLLLAATLLTSCATPPPAPSAPPQVPAQVSSADWEQDLQRFAAQDAIAPPPRDAVLFVGSSSIRMWETLAADFPQVRVINRGFGGSEIRDSTWYAQRLILDHAPRQVLLYAGDNDLFSGRSPAQLRDDFREFVRTLRRAQPGLRIAYLSTKPSPSRAQLLEAQRQANALIAAEAKRLDVDFIDVFTPMLDAAGQPRAELFLPDQLHMNAAGYALWRELIGPYLVVDP